MMVVVAVVHCVMIDWEEGGRAGVLHGGQCYFSHIKLLDSLAPGT